MEAVRCVLVSVIVLVLYLSTADGSICHYPGRAVSSNSSGNMAAHVFNDEKFWEHFQRQVKLGSWKCNFPSDLLHESMDKDAKLYSNDTIFRNRRTGVSKLMKNETEWINLILGACREIADGRTGVHSLQLKNLNVLEALVDFVEHLNCFYTVALDMASKDKVVKPLSQDSSRIHDIDKLDPVMLVGYSERFEDNKTTTVWNVCVDRHTHVNPHHQAHCLWHKTCCNETACRYCEQILDRALLEMICDKVSRRLQKSLHGKISDDMWDVEAAFFKGLPEEWLEKAFAIMESLKSNDSRSKLDGLVFHETSFV